MNEQEKKIHDRLMESWAIIKSRIKFDDLKTVDDVSKLLLEVANVERLLMSTNISVDETEAKE